MADDWGCFNADPDIIKGLAYPKRKETVRQIIKIRDIFYNAGKLFVWTDENGRTWGFFPSWDNHQFCNALGIDEEGKYTKHRRKTPEPPTTLLEQYLSKFDNVRQDSTEFVNPNPIPNPNPKHKPIDFVNEKKNISWKDKVNRGVQEVIDYAHSKNFGLQGTIKANRFAASNLIKKKVDGEPMGVERVKKLIDLAVACRGERYAPQVNDFVQLSKKWLDLMAFGEKKMQTKGRIG